MYVKDRLCKMKLRWGRNGWSEFTIQLNFTQDHSNCKKIFTTIWDCSHALLHFGHLVRAHRSCTLTILSFVTWANSKIWKLKLLDVAQAWRKVSTWLEKLEWNITWVRKMLWHVPYFIDVSSFRLWQSK